MKVSSYIYAVIASMFLVTLGGCRAEEDFPAIDKEDCYQLQFGLSILPPQTRATEEGVPDPLNENKITRMDAFIYDGDVQRGHFSTEKGDLVVDATPNATAGTATIYVPKTSNLSVQYTGHDYDLYVLVNYHGGENLDGRTLTNLKAIKLTSDAMLQSTVTPQADFLMDGNMKTGNMTWAGGGKYNITTTTHETLKLSRAAAKVRVRLDAEIVIQDNKTKYEAVGEPTITFKSFTNETSLFAGKPVLTPKYNYIDDDQPMVKAEYKGKIFWAREVPYYCYENDWSLDARLRTYAVIKLHVKKEGETDDKATETYYSVPLNYMAVKDGMTPEQIAGMPKVQRNHLYDIQCTIKQLGSTEPTKPVDIPLSYIAVEEWNTPNAIDAAITKAHYLVVKETHPEMLNTDERFVEYLSDLPLDLNEINSSTINYEYTQYETDGTQRQITGANNEGNIRIKVDTLVQNGKKYLKITNPIPNNYVPLTFRFRVWQIQDPDDNSAIPLYKDVVVTQYPPVYVTAKKSAGSEIYWYSPFTGYNDDGPAGAGFQSNGTLFKITTLAPQDGTIVGDPTFGTDRTDRGEEANKITSPQFIVASQWGMSTAVPQYTSGTSRGWTSYNYAFESATGIRDEYARSRNSGWVNGTWQNYTESYRYRDYSNADERAYNYWEDDYGVSGTRIIQGDDTGYRNRLRRTTNWTHTFKYDGHWRIPTLAELALIVKIQTDPNSAVKSLLWGHQYWSARTGWAYDFDNGYAYQRSQATSIRPVFDTYDKNDSQDTNKW